MKKKYMKVTFEDTTSVFIAMDQRYIFCDFLEIANINEKYEVKVVNLSKKELGMLWKFSEGCYFQIKGNEKIFEIRLMENFIENKRRIKWMMKKDEP